MSGAPSATIAPPPARQPAAVPSGAFLACMRMLASGCAVIAARHEGQRAGLTATAVCSVTADPPRIIVCVNRKVRAHALIANSAALSVNMLTQSHETVARRFAGLIDGVVGEERFVGADWDEGVTGSPILKDALFSLDCRVIEAIPASTHSIFLCEVVEARSAEAAPLLYFNGRFAAVS